MRLVLRSCTIFALALLVAGCQTVSHAVSAAAASAGLAPQRRSVAIDDSQFDRSITVRGIEHGFNGSPVNDLFLRSWITKADGTVSHQIYVVDHYSGDWKFWNRANDQVAAALEFTPISRDVGSCVSSCAFWESFGITVADRELRSHPDGYAVKVYARSGASMVLTVAPDQIAAQLAAVDSVASRVRIGHAAHP